MDDKLKELMKSEAIKYINEGVYYKATQLLNTIEQISWEPTQGTALGLAGGVEANNTVGSESSAEQLTPA